jgi:hypothetical protein
MKRVFRGRRLLLLGLLFLANISIGCDGPPFQAGIPDAGDEKNELQPFESNDNAGGSGSFCQKGTVLGCATTKNLLLCGGDGSTVEIPCNDENPICTNKGSCVQCLSSDDCKGDPGVCFKWQCNQQQNCEKKPLQLGTDCGKEMICNGEGQCGNCEPEMKRCSNDKVETCDINGTWQPSGTCSEQGLICGAGQCSAPNKLVSHLDFSCLRLENGALFCWGKNTSGQIGGAALDVPIPSEISTLGSVDDVVVGASHTCALQHGEVYCWGGNAWFQLGNNQIGNNPNPSKVQGISNVTHLAAGGFVTCAITNKKLLYCWGANNNGQLGSGKTDTELPQTEKPTLVPLTSVEEVAVSAYHTCAITSGEQGKKVYCWGTKFSFFGGEVFAGSALGDGDGTAHKRFSPYLVDYPDLLDPDQLTLSFDKSCVRSKINSATYEIVCWGSSDYISDLPQSFGLYHIVSGDLWLRFSLGWSHVCYSSGDSGVLCKGSNSFGEVGNGMPSKEPVKEWKQLSALPATTLALGYNNSCMIHRNLNDAKDLRNYVYCWGQNNHGQLGNGTLDLVIKPGQPIFTKSNLFFFRNLASTP